MAKKTPNPRELYNEYRRMQYQENKEKYAQYRIASAVHLLEKNGYTIIPPAAADRKDGQA